MTRIAGPLRMTVVLALALSVASAGTKLVETKSPGPKQEAPPRKILVLALSKDPQNRSTFEDALAGELTLRGATAVAAHISFPELPQERGPFEAKLVAEGFDALTVTCVVGTTTKVKETIRFAIKCEVLDRSKVGIEKTLMTEESESADVLIHPFFGESKWHDFHNFNRYIEAGRRATEAALPLIRTLMAPQKGRNPGHETIPLIPAVGCGQT